MFVPAIAHAPMRGIQATSVPCFFCVIVLGSASHVLVMSCLCSRLQAVQLLLHDGTPDVAFHFAHVLDTVQLSAIKESHTNQWDSHIAFVCIFVGFVGDLRQLKGCNQD